MGWVDGNQASGLYREMIQSYKQSNGGLIAHTWQLWMICGIELWFRAAFLGAGHASSEVLPGCEIQPVYGSQAMVELERKISSIEAARPSLKKTYISPNLLEYGNIAKLTQKRRYLQGLIVGEQLP